MRSWAHGRRMNSLCPMSNSMKDISVDFSWGAGVLLCLLILYGSGELMLPLAAAAAVHEAGHLCAIYALGGRVTAVKFNIGGICLEYDTSGLTYFKELICALSGPIAGAAAAIAAAHFGNGVFGGISLAFSVFNLLPVRPLDGGRAAFCIAASFLDLQAAEKLCGVVDFTAAMLVTAAGAYAAYVSGGNVTLLFMGAVLVICYCKER